MRLRPSKKVSDEQLSRFSTLGQRVGRYIQRNKRWRYIYLWISAAGRKHNKIVSSLLLLFCSSILIWGILPRQSETPEFGNPLPPLEGIEANYDDSIRRTQQKIDALLLEAKDIGDSIDRLLSKDTLTRSDSIYVITHTQYLSELKKLIQR